MEARTIIIQQKIHETSLKYQVTPKILQSVPSHKELA